MRLKIFCKIDSAVLPCKAIIILKGALKEKNVKKSDGLETEIIVEIIVKP